jgi:uncharacterized protein YecE (DUF72 family)
MDKKNISVYDVCKKFKNKIRIGTCSWNYPEWQEIGIYSTKQKRHYDYLPEYAEHFNTAEVDQWFWSLDFPDSVRLPKKEDVEAYAKLTPKDFRFTIKAPNSIILTHFYKQAPKEYAEKPNPHFLSKKVMDAFLKSIKPLGEKVALIEFEFEYLNKQKMPNVEAYFDQIGPFLDKLPHDYSYGIETRNPNYINPEWFHFLKSHNTAHVFADGGYMPSPKSIYEKFGDASLPTKTVVIRLLGADRLAIEKKTGKRWSKIVEPRQQTLFEIAQMATQLYTKKFSVYANINNHLEGSAPLSIEELAEELERIAGKPIPKV